MDLSAAKMTSANAESGFEVYFTLYPEINANHAQLVFTTYDTWQLSNQLLRRDEIWFVEKDESYEKNYLIGKYGEKGQNRG